MSAVPPRVVRLLCSFVLLAGVSPALCCPFCTAVGPTLAQRREAAQIVALGELLERDDEQLQFRIHQVLAGKEKLDAKTVSLPASGDLRPGALALLLAVADEEEKNGALDWSHLGVNELSYAYIARAPSLRVKTAQRLRYFAPFLEHADRLVAEDAYLEFAHAPYDVVAEVAVALDFAKLRRWLLDDAVPDSRKGFYGLALGLAQDPAAKRRNSEFLEKLIEEPGDDFRSGLDGVMGGYLVAAGLEGLERLERLYLADPQAAEGHVRHAMTALRFYQQYGRGIPAPRLAAALRLLLRRPEFAAAAIVDLARWEDWDSLPQVVALYEKDKHLSPRVKRAIVGYLLASPREAAARELDRLRRLDFKTIAEAEKSISRFGGSR